MKKEIIISGFGGQGGLAIGKNLAEAGMAEGLNVTWAPSYGPEMRGGTANCSVVLSDKPVGSTVFAHPTELIALNEPSLSKFEAGVVSGGCVFINSDVVTDKVSRPDLTGEEMITAEDIAEIAAFLVLRRTNAVIDEIEVHRANKAPFA